MRFQFTKMQGCGNDFLILDMLSEEELIPLTRAEILYLCNRNYGIGADGIAVLGRSRVADVKWRFYNSDGNEAEMCGNAARCVIRLMTDRYPVEQELVKLETLNGVIKGRKLKDEFVEVTLLSQPVQKLDYEDQVLKFGDEALRIYFIDTGVPHAVVEVEELAGYPVSKVGKFIHDHPLFLPEKTNVTFFEKTVGNQIYATTFERGVEKETFACGTGAAAASLVYSQLYMQPLPIEVLVPGGTLVVSLSEVAKMLLLQGPVEYICHFELDDIPQTFEPRQLFGK